MPVSELEKRADKIIRRAKMPNRTERSREFNGGSVSLLIRNKL